MFAIHQGFWHVICAGCGQADSLPVRPNSLAPKASLAVAAANARRELFWDDEGNAWQCIDCRCRAVEVDYTNAGFPMSGDVELDLSHLPQAFRDEHWKELCAWDKYKHEKKRFALRWPDGMGTGRISDVWLERHAIVVEGRNVIRVAPSLQADARIIADYSTALEDSLAAAQHAPAA